MTALTNAASSGHAYIVKLLLAHADIDANLQNEVNYQLLHFVIIIQPNNLVFEYRCLFLCEVPTLVFFTFCV